MMSTSLNDGVEHNGKTTTEGGVTTTSTTSTSTSMSTSITTTNTSSIIIFGKKYVYTSFTLWRIAFYLLMAYNWQKIFHGPLGGPWHDSMTYDHTEFLYDKLAPNTIESTEKLRWFGFIIALLSIFNNQTTILFAILTGQHIFTSLIMFINHHYLFFLLSTLMAIYCNCNKNNIHDRSGWHHALRGQIIVVYAFASLWKFDIDWIDGTIIKGIFLSFEDQGVHRGIPWHQLYDTYGPNLFVFLGCSGLLLDFLLFVVLMFLKPGNKLQSVAIIFHGFTGYTMSQRIGYSFPLAMILASLLFQPSNIIDQDQIDIVGGGGGRGHGDALSHAEWLLLQIVGSKSTTTLQKKRLRRRHILPLIWLLFQWLIPLRMPFISNFEHKNTFEGYRWSWTMMLHGKVNMHSPGISFMTLRPTCNGNPYPNPQATNNPFWDIHSFQYEDHLQSSIRAQTVMQMFPRQMPKVFYQVNEIIGDQCTTTDMVMKTAYFSSVNEGPFRRIIDPTIDLLTAYHAHANLPWLSKLWYAIIDRSPPDHEFVLRGSGSIDILPEGNVKNKPDEITLVDRSSCLQIDPIRIHSNQFSIKFDTDSDVPFRLLLRGCPELNLQNCQEMYINKGEEVHLSAIRTVTIGIDKRAVLGNTTCSESTKEDVVIKLTQIQNIGGMMEPPQDQD